MRQLQEHLPRLGGHSSTLSSVWPSSPDKRTAAIGWALAQHGMLRGCALWMLASLRAVRGAPGAGRIRSAYVSGEASEGVWCPTLPFSVVAANSLAAASADGDSSMASVVVHASCYAARQPGLHVVCQLQHTDFWNCSRYWCACSFCALVACVCIMLCAASTGSKPACPPFAAMLVVCRDVVGGMWMRRAPGVEAQWGFNDMRA